MSTKRTSYSSEFKVKVVLELLANELTLAELASKHNITTKNIQNWKKIFLDNAVIAMEPAKAVKEYKSENNKLQHEVDKYAKKVYSTPNCQYSFLKIIIPIHVMQPAMFFAPDF